MKYNFSLKKDGRLVSEESGDSQPQELLARLDGAIVGEKK